MARALYLSELLRPRGVPLPAMLAADVQVEWPWLVLERLPGTDLGALIADLSDSQLDHIAASFAQAQVIGTAGRYGYAAFGRRRPRTPRGRRCWTHILPARGGASPPPVCSMPASSTACSRFTCAPFCWTSCLSTATGSRGMNAHPLLGRVGR